MHWIKFWGSVWICIHLIVILDCWISRTTHLYAIYCILFLTKVCHELRVTEPENKSYMSCVYYSSTCCTIHKHLKHWTNCISACIVVSYRNFNSTITATVLRTGYDWMLIEKPVNSYFVQSIGTHTSWHDKNCIKCNSRHA